VPEARDVPYVLEIEVSRHNFPKLGAHFFFNLDFEHFTRYGGTVAPSAEARRASGCSIEEFLSDLETVVGGDTVFSIVRVEGTVDPTPPMSVALPALGEGKYQLQPVGIVYRGEAAGPEVSELEWRTPEQEHARTPNRIEFAIKYGMVDTWASLKPWESEKKRTLEFLRKSLK
jgi:hypothetical protein